MPLDHNASSARATTKDIEQMRNTVRTMVTDYTKFGGSRINYEDCICE